MVFFYRNWFLIWLGLEINIIRFILMIYQYKDIKRVEICIRYFFIQSVGSALLMILLYLGVYFIGGLGIIVLRYKLGVGPFYFWFLNICKRLRWERCFFLISFQKFLPIFIISIIENKIIWVIVVVRLLIGLLGSFNQVDLKQLIGYSSVHHVGWIIIGVFYKNQFWMIYLILYGVVIFSVIYYLSLMKCVYINQLVGVDKKLFFIRILSLGGIPPFLGFFMKLWFFYYMAGLYYFIFIFIVMVSVVMLYIYIRLVYEIIVNRGVIKSFYSCIKIRGGDLFIRMCLVIGVFVDLFVL